MRLRNAGGRWGGQWLVMAGLVGLYIVVRCLHLDRFVTTDEPFWLGRSANFYRALAHLDVRYTYQMAHPGVLTMWAGTFGYLWAFPAYADLVSSNLTHVYGIGSVLRELDENPMQVLIAARIAKIVLSSLAFGLALVFLGRLFGRWVMAISGALIALDPFVSGMDSLLHVDGLFAMTAFAAVLALADATRARPDAMRPWLVAGVVAACAWMTRATGLVLGAIAVATVMAPLMHRRRVPGGPSLRSRLESPTFSLMLWATGAGLASLLLLPALWVDPFGTLQQVWDWSSNAASEGHERPIFFRGTVVYGDPGMWFYPITLVWRLTPPVLAGLVASIVLVPLAVSRGWLTREQRRALLVLVGFALAYVVVMSLGAKKFDRYILPVYPIVMVCAAQGGVIGARLLRTLRPSVSTVVLPIIASVLVLGQAIALAGALPYRLDYYSPLLGGLERAQHHVQVGWGEGARDAVAFIVDDAAGRDVVVQTSSVTPVLSYFAPGNVRFASFGLGTPAGWFETDYFVPGIQEWQRGLSPSYTTMQAYEPAHVVEIAGVPFFAVYTPRQLPLPDHLRTSTQCTTTVGDGLQLMQIVGRDDTIDLYWLTTGDVPAHLEGLLTLRYPEESFPSVSSGWVAWEPASVGMMSRVTVSDPRPPGAPPLAGYDLLFQVRDRATGDLLPVASDRLNQDTVTVRTHSECYYGP